MKTKIFDDPAVAQQFVDDLTKNKSVVDAQKLQDGTWKILWVESKEYTSVDGKVYDDEVWTKQDGTMIVVQDLELAHAHNIIRMMLRNQQLQAAQLEAIQSSIEAYNDGLSDEDQEIHINVVDTRVLH